MASVQVDERITDMVYDQTRFAWLRIPWRLVARLCQSSITVHRTHYPSAGLYWHATCCSRVRVRASRCARVLTPPPLWPRIRHPPVVDMALTATTTTSATTAALSTSRATVVDRLILPASLATPPASSSPVWSTTASGSRWLMRPSGSDIAITYRDFENQENSALPTLTLALTLALTLTLTLN